MAGTDDNILEPEGSGEIRVANPTAGVYVFYTGESEEFIRTDCVVDVTTKW